MKGRPWTTTEEAILRKRYPHESARRIGLDIDRTHGAVVQHARGMGLRKANRHAHRKIYAQEVALAMTLHEIEGVPYCCMADAIGVREDYLRCVIRKAKLHGFAAVPMREK